MYKLIIFVLLLLCLVPYTNAKIVFMSAWEIFVMDDDGTNVQRLTFNSIYDSSPSWSPDGKHIAFVREQERETNEQNYDLFLMNTNGTNVRKLTTYTGIDINPNWSPDNQHIAFTSTRGDKTSIHIMDVNTQTVRKLLLNLKENAAQHPSWSPDGKQIVYAVTQFDPFLGAIYIVDVNEKKPRLLVRHIPALFYAVNWSPDGEHILYGEEKHGNNRILSEKLIIRTIKGHLVKEIKFPNEKGWIVAGACWMGTQHLLLSAIADHGRGQSDILRYTIATGEILNLTNTPRANDSHADWIDDDALAVFPAAKLTLKWGLLKQPD